eukprot:m.22799 g.22799  ORF g.22799 m.22799 type:complete len:424 (-) comp8371_c0_seq1:647-1918(-)
MAEQSRRYDLVVFGATGFTGKFVAKLLDERNVEYSIALGGRNDAKLNEVVQTLKNPGKFSKIIADVSDESSLIQMCSQARVVLNCVGPYRFYGEAVVRACLVGGAHYLDITGEPEFIERMELKFAKSAEEKGLVIVSACGFDSIPADLGVLFTARSFPAPSFPTSIESYLTLDSGGLGVKGHYTTYECAVHGFGSQKSLANIRKQRGAAPLSVPGPRLPKRGKFFFSRDARSYCVPFPGSDASIVRRTQLFYASAGDASLPRPVHYAAYFTLPSLFWSIVFLLFGTVFAFLASFRLTRVLLLKFPGFFSFGRFSHEGPTAEHLRRTTFEMVFHAKGYSQPPPAAAAAPAPAPDCSVVTAVSGPEPGYVATPIFLVDSALCLLEERALIPSGVLTTAAAFAKTKLIERLQKSGIKFELRTRRLE